MLHPSEPPGKVTTTALHLLRLLARRSQREVAEAIGCKQETLARWERGNTTPDLRMARSLAQIYGIPVDLVDAVVEIETLGLDPETIARPGQAIAVLRIPADRAPDAQRLEP